MPTRKKKPKPTTRKAAKKPAVKRKAAKPSPKKRTPRADRIRILAEMKVSGMTAKVAAKKYGISMWTIYNWRKRGGASKATLGRRGRPARGRASGSLGEMLRPLVAEMVHEELARLAGR